MEKKYIDHLGIFKMKKTILISIIIIFSCSKSQSIPEVENLYDESDIGYGMQVKKSNNSTAYFLLEPNSDTINIIVNNSEIVCRSKIGVNITQKNLFRNVIKKQLSVNNALKKSAFDKKNGIVIKFGITSMRSILYSDYLNVKDFNKDISLDLNHIINMIKKDTVANTFFANGI